MNNRLPLTIALLGLALAACTVDDSETHETQTAAGASGGSAGAAAGTGGTGGAGASGAAGSGGAAKEHHDCGWVAPGATFHPVPEAMVGLCIPPNVVMLPSVQNWTVMSVPNEKGIRAVFAFTVQPANPSPEAVLQIKGKLIGVAGTKIGWDALPVGISAATAECYFLDNGGLCEAFSVQFSTLPFTLAYAYQPGGGDIPYAMSRSVERL